MASLHGINPAHVGYAFQVEPPKNLPAAIVQPDPSRCALCTLPLGEVRCRTYLCNAGPVFPFFDTHDRCEKTIPARIHVKAMQLVLAHANEFAKLHGLPQVGWCAVTPRMRQVTLAEQGRTA